MASLAQHRDVALPVFGSDERFPVRRIYCVGRNYVEHIREMKEGDERDPPFFFQKPTDALVTEGQDLPYPPYTQDYQHEVELVAAIGRGGRNIMLEAAPEHIAGYAIGMDMTRRDRQREARARGLPWEIGKSFDHSAPCGPLHLVGTAGHPAKGTISLSVNGVERQRGDLSEMIWNVAEIVANLSQQYELRPGDLIFTGTPAGVGALQPGDRMDAEIEGLGRFSIVVGPGKR